ncbi:ExeA family protein [Lysobacter brunescens]|uniref:ExeA family protein n=1 Tax=Lysobacter brunescens TaxID=262323 RepID=A0ABW2YBA5_9GAMM
MYLEYYGLEQTPFSITPDPHYVFLSEHHRDALAHLLYGIQQGGGGGFVQLTGEVGTGKTTLSRLLLNQLPGNTHAALVLNPRLDPVELLQTICEELKLTPGEPASDAAETPDANDASEDATSSATPAPTASPVPAGGKVWFDRLGAYLLDAYARGDRVVLIIDEAQNLSAEALEQVRLLTNLETETQKLLQIILIGQPELRDSLARPELRQLAQRITARYHLRPLDAHGTGAYLRHRLTTAGAKRFPFTADAVKRIHRHSGGVPRLINVIAERALLGGYAQDLLAIDAKTVDRAASEALAPGGSDIRKSTQDRTPLMIGGGLVLATLLIAFALSRRDASETTVPVAEAKAQASTATSAAPSTPATQPAAASVTTALDGEALLLRVQQAPPEAAREWQSLQARWKAPATVRKVTADACPAQPAPGWRCLRSRATLDQLLRVDRPVLLRLRAEPKATWASLLGANPGTDAGSVRLSIEGKTFDADRVALASLWNGEYLALWPAPDTIEARFNAGDARAVAWVRARLRDDGIDDADPVVGLRTFKLRHGLRNDAALGGDTLFVLASRGSGPRLSTATGTGG